MLIYYPGQRWLSEVETEYGIGTILAVGDRHITVLYRAVMETRVYAKHNAPLTRVKFGTGDTITTNSGTSLHVDKVLANEHGVITYVGRDQDNEPGEVHEVDIDHRLAIHGPAGRLLSGQIDDDRWFTLRLQARYFEGMLWRSSVRGLQGARMSLVPHQLYIAARITRKGSARALLADEVGLGKTIEACLVLHRYIVQGQCKRALIIVPAALVNQWLVELLRRFNLSFSVFDEECCQDLESSGENPFIQSQFVLCSLALFENTSRLQQALQAGWDMLIVDEAHHLHWTPEESGRDYASIELLSEHIPSVLLLTATPEQLGRQGHFARLRLLDPDRFHNLEKFITEEQEFEPVADLAEAILAETISLDSLTGQLASYGIQTAIDGLSVDRESLVRQLVDLHGTSRLLFRNTRKTIHGFPQRMTYTYPLEYALALPEQAVLAIYEEILDNDPRVPWLIEMVRRLRPEKCLLICSRADTALNLEEHLQRKEGIRCIAFHERLSIIRRDRAAAWFAEKNGADILLCSEIGSEGRNFQFAHHLILFDLPMNPDLLEQRIGRLDRVGQHTQVNLHIPYIKGSAHQYLLEWYQQVTHIFQSPDIVAISVREQSSNFRSDLFSESEEQIGLLIKTDTAVAESRRESMRKGRDRLLSLSSFDKSEALDIVREIKALDSDKRLAAFMEYIYDMFGIESEYHSELREVIRPGDHMTEGYFPFLTDEGTLITYDRNTALIHEDTQFLTWDHPMVTGAIDTVTSGEFGNSVLSLVRHDTLPISTSLLELIYRVDCPGPADLPAHRYIEQPIIRLLLDNRGRNMANKLPHEELTDTVRQIDRVVAQRAIGAQAKEIRDLIRESKELASRKLATIIDQAEKNLQRHCGEEIQRLAILTKHNSNLTAEDMRSYIEYRDEMLGLLRQATAKLDALRLVVISD